MAERCIAARWRAFFTCNASGELSVIFRGLESPRPNFFPNGHWTGGGGECSSSLTLVGGLSQDWVGGKTLFVFLGSHSLWGRKHINKTPRKSQGFSRANVYSQHRQNYLNSYFQAKVGKKLPKQLPEPLSVGKLDIGSFAFSSTANTLQARNYQKYFQGGSKSVIYILPDSLLK